MTIEVGTSCGRLGGAEESGCLVFKGIPYAAPPAGDLRFQAPQPPDPWSGVRDATTFGPACPQPRPVLQRQSVLQGLFGPAELETSEDCLSLNIWTPGPEGRRAVMVFVHGGAFRTGTGASPMYDGSRLSRRGDVVVVTLNYRLGVLGFLYEPSLGGANFGIQDQVAALRWVRDEIAAFGGNPDNVTVFGESAGGKSVECLLATPAAKGLFRRAIIESTYDPPLDRASAAATASRYLDYLSPEGRSPERLRTLPFDALIDAQQRMSEEMMQRGATGGVAGGGFVPVVDGAILPRLPEEAFADGFAADTPVIVGTNEDESRLFRMGAENLDRETVVLRLAGLIAARGGSPEDARRLVDAYEDARRSAERPFSPADVWFAISSDRTFRYHSVRVAEALSRHQPSTYMYLFSWKSPAFDGELGAFHALELPFVFGVFDTVIGKLAGDDLAKDDLSTQVQDAWIAFARSGDPNHPGLPSWRPYDASERQTMVFDRQSALRRAPLEAERQALDELEQQLAGRQPVAREAHGGG